MWRDIHSFIHSFFLSFFLSFSQSFWEFIRDYSYSEVVNTAVGLYISLHARGATMDDSLQQEFIHDCSLTLFSFTLIYKLSFLSILELGALLSSHLKGEI